MVSFNFITDSTERVCPLNTREVSFVKSHTRNVSSLLVLTIVVSFNFITERTGLVCPSNTRGGVPFVKSTLATYDHDLH